MALITARRLTLTLKQPHAPIATLTKETVNHSLQTQRQALQDSYQQIADAVNSTSMVGPTASLPPAGEAGRFYYSADSSPPDLKIDNGGSWVPLLPVNTLLTVAPGDSPYTIPAPQASSWTFVMVTGTDAKSPTAITLPAATGSAAIIVVRKLDVNPYSVTFSPAGSDTVDGETGTLYPGQDFDRLQQKAANLLVVRRLVDYGRGTWASF